MTLRSLFRSRVPGWRLMVRGVFVVALALLVGVSVLLHTAFVLVRLGQEIHVQNVQVASQIRVTLTGNINSVNVLPSSGYQNSTKPWQTYHERTADEFSNSKMVLRRPFVIEYVNNSRRGRQVETTVKREVAKLLSQGSPDKNVHPIDAKNIQPSGPLIKVPNNVGRTKVLRSKNSSSSADPSFKASRVTMVTKPVPKNKPPNARKAIPTVMGKTNHTVSKPAKRSAPHKGQQNVDVMNPSKNIQRNSLKPKMQVAVLEIHDLDAKTDEEWEVQEDWTLDQLFPSSNKN